LIAPPWLLFLIFSIIIYFLVAGDLCAEGRLDDVLLRAYFNHLSNSHSFDSNHNRSQSSDHAASNSRSEDGARDLNVGLDVVHAEFATLFLHQFLNEVKPFRIYSFSKCSNALVISCSSSPTSIFFSLSSALFKPIIKSIEFLLSHRLHTIANTFGIFLLPM